MEWVDVPDRLAASTSTRMQFTDDQITRSRTFEGASWGDGGAYIVASYARADCVVGIQTPGHVLAITGPWDRQPI